MEEVNSKLLQQFDGMAKQNAELSRTVREMSRRLGTAPAATPGAGSGSLGDSPRKRRRWRSGGGRRHHPLAAQRRPLLATLGRRDPVKADQGPRPAVGVQRPELPATATGSSSSRRTRSTSSGSTAWSRSTRGSTGSTTSPRHQRHRHPPDPDVVQRAVDQADRVPGLVPAEHQQLRHPERLRELPLRRPLPDPGGRYRAPFTYEWAKLSIWELPTPERSPFAINFGPNRQVGADGLGQHA